MNDVELLRAKSSYFIVLPNNFEITECKNNPTSIDHE